MRRMQIDKVNYKKKTQELKTIAQQVTNNITEIKKKKTNISEPQIFDLKNIDLNWNGSPYETFQHLKSGTGLSIFKSINNKNYSSLDFLKYFNFYLNFIYFLFFLNLF